MELTANPDSMTAAEIPSDTGKLASRSVSLTRCRVFLFLDISKMFALDDFFEVRKCRNELTKTSFKPFRTLSTNSERETEESMAKLSPSATSFRSDCVELVDASLKSFLVFPSKLAPRFVTSNVSSSALHTLRVSVDALRGSGTLMGDFLGDLFITTAEID
jgi:hypothetical protein